MVFSFFKKAPPEKMVARPAAAPVRPKQETPPPAPPSPPSGTGAAAQVDEAREPRPELAPLDFTGTGAAPVAAPAPAPEVVSPSDFSDLSETPGDIHVENDMDPIEADIEQAAVLYANAQDQATRALLENSVHVHHYGPGERLWLMLFDLYRLTNQHVPFDALAIEYAKSFEKSPPAWRNNQPAKPVVKDAAPAGTVLFKGDITGANDAAFIALDQAVDKNPKLRVDMTKVKLIDDLGAERMLGVLAKVLKKKTSIELIGRDCLVQLLEARVEPGKREDAGCWLLLLECYQLMGKQEVFEDTAINYAVTFEMSPPSWDQKRVAAPEPKAVVPAAGTEDDEAVSRFELKGDLKSERFGGLPAFIEKSDPVVIDFSAVTRIDFVSAGTLVNLLTPPKRAGKRIIIKHPNHLVAELLRVVGVAGVAEIAFVKA